MQASVVTVKRNHQLFNMRKIKQEEELPICQQLIERKETDDENKTLIQEDLW